MFTLRISSLDDQRRRNEETTDKKTKTKSTKFITERIKAHLGTCETRTLRHGESQRNENEEQAKNLQKKTVRRDKSTPKDLKSERYQDKPDFVSYVY